MNLYLLDGKKKNIYKIKNIKYIFTFDMIKYLIPCIFFSFNILFIFDLIKI